MQAAPLPKSVLGYHRILAPNASVRVSPLCLGAMNFGDAWKGFMGECNQEQSFAMLDFFYGENLVRFCGLGCMLIVLMFPLTENGGNFIDTANAYQEEQSETWLGEWMEKRGVRDQMVIATKYSSGYRRSAEPNAMHSNYTGNSTKSLHLSVEASLKKLRTTYIDILYLHWWDWTTGIPEVMKSLNTLCDQGKVLYLGISDTPAWIVSKANQYARDHGLRQFVVYQGKWSAAERDFEREIIPMCEAEGMALAPWGALGRGNFKTDEQRQSGEGRKLLMGTETEIKVSKVLEKIANRKNTLITSVALAYVMHKTANVFPIVGGRKIEHLRSNIEALKLKLTPADIDEIEDAYPFDYGFPNNFLFMGQKKPSLRGQDVFVIKMSSHLDTPERPKPIEPRSD